MRSLRIYGWTDTESAGQFRCVVAAHSRAEAARKTHRLPYQLFNLCETANNREREVALQKPGTVYRCSLVDSFRSDTKWTPAT